MGLIARLKKKRIVKEYLSGKGIACEIGGCWGHAVNWQNYSEREVVGWQPVIPQVGDWLTCSMQSGRTNLFRFVSIKRCGDPSDMFFGKVKGIDYIKEARSKPKVISTKPNFLTY